MCTWTVSRELQSFWELQIQYFTRMDFQPCLAQFQLFVKRAILLLCKISDLLTLEWVPLILYSNSTTLELCMVEACCPLILLAGEASLFRV